MGSDVSDRELADERVRPVDPVELFRLLARSLGQHDVARATEHASSRATFEVVRSQELPSFDVGATQFRDKYLLKEVLRKFAGWDSGIDKGAAALQGFKAQEIVNAATTERLLSRNVEGYDPRVRQVYDLSCRKAIAILGKFSWSRFLEGCRFGPGATTGHTSMRYVLSNKLLSGSLDVTERARSLLSLYLSDFAPGWGKHVLVSTEKQCEAAALEPDRFRGTRDANGNVLAFNVVRGDKFSTAPKDATTDRTILIQPCGLGLLQLGLGYSMRLALANAGINLQDQRVNQRLALQGSLEGTVATVDVKNASNAIVPQLVWDHLGNHSSDFTDARWYLLADALRTTEYQVDGEWHKHELFSAMGNGYTFELETLLFYSLAAATCTFLGVPEDVSVYGDDIICPVGVIPLLREVLAYAGFELNMAKSHYSAAGPRFRESCGKHYFQGMDVTPVYCKSLSTEMDLILLHNNLIRWSKSPVWGKDKRLRNVCEWLVGHLSPRSRKTAIPFGDENDGLIKDFDVACPTVVTARTGVVPHSSPWTDVRGFKARTVDLKLSSRKLDDYAGLLCALYHASVRKVSIPKSVAPGVAALESRVLRRYRVDLSGSFAESAEPYKELTSKKVTLEYGRRSVITWMDTGHWCDVGRTLLPVDTLEACEGSPPSPSTGCDAGSTMVP